MKQTPVRSVILSALFLALGLAVPQLFHAVGLGTTFLPMHFPVLLCGFFVGWQYAALVGALTPVLSFLLTGMPPAFPVLFFMVPELLCYGLLTALLARRLPVLVTLPAAMVGGRLVSAAAVWLMVAVFGVQLPHPWAYVAGAIFTGLPGIVLQLLTLPIFVLAIERYRRGLNEPA